MMDKPVGASLEPAPLSFLELERIDSYWRAANYLSVGQIYLYDNPLLRTPLSPQHIKPRLLGHWGTTPGQNFVYVHLNRVIKRHDLDVIYISGPGHGGPSGVGSPESRRERSGGMTHGSRVPPEDAENRALACAIALGRKPQMEEGPMIDSPHVNTLDGCIPWGDAVEPPPGAIASNDERHGEEYGCVDWFCYEPQSRDQPVPAV